MDPFIRYSFPGMNHCSVRLELKLELQILFLLRLKSILDSAFVYILKNTELIHAFLKTNKQTKTTKLKPYRKLQFKAPLSSHPLTSFCNPDDAWLIGVSPIKLFLFLCIHRCKSFINSANRTTTPNNTKRNNKENVY